MDLSMGSPQTYLQEPEDDDNSGSMRAYAEWLQCIAVETFLRDKTHCLKLLMFGDHGLASASPCRADYPFNASACPRVMEFSRLATPLMQLSPFHCCLAGNPILRQYVFRLSTRIR